MSDGTKSVKEHFQVGSLWFHPKRGYTFDRDCCANCKDTCNCTVILRDDICNCTGYILTNIDNGKLTWKKIDEE